MSSNEPNHDGRAPRRLRDHLWSARWHLVGLGTIGSVVVITSWQGGTVPRAAKVFSLALVAGAVIGYLPAARIVTWLFDPPYKYLVDLDARDDQFAVWELPPDDWREIEVEEGDLFPLQAAQPTWECRHYDAEANVATGTWRGSATDLELITERGRINEIRGTLEDLAKEGLGHRVMQSGIVRAAVRNVVLSFVETFERDAVYDGDEIRRAVERTLDEWEYDAGDTLRGSVGDDGSLAEANVGREAFDPSVDWTGEFDDD